MKTVLFLLFLLFLHPGAAQAATLVDLELILAADISFSVDEEEAKRQREGAVAALRSNEVLHAILSGPHGRIAIGYVEWADDGSARMITPWAMISSQAEAEAFATTLHNAPFVQGRYTAIGSAITTCVELIENNLYDGARKMIDISGDGPQNQGKALPAARQLAAAHNININALPVHQTSQSPWQPKPMSIDQYYRKNVIIGPGSFSMPANTFLDFKEAILKKLVLEIAWGNTNSPSYVRLAP